MLNNVHIKLVIFILLYMPYSGKINKFIYAQTEEMTDL